MVASVIVALGCRPDPGGAADPGPVSRVEHWSIGVGEARLGAEERRFGDGFVVRATRWAWGSEQREVVRGGGCAPELTGAAGCVGARVVGDVVEVDSAAGVVRVRLDASGRPEEVQVGRVVSVRVPEAPALDDVDPADALALPARPLPNARSARIADWSVDGRAVRTEAPTPAELSKADRTFLLAAIDRVRDRHPSEKCVGLSRALVATLEAEGLDAELVAGRLHHEGRLVLHAWVEVTLGGRRVPVDPGLRQVPADAARLPLGRDLAEVVAHDGQITLDAAR